MVYEATASGQRSWPYGDHPDDYLSYSSDGRMYAIGVADDRPKPRDLVPMGEEHLKLQGAESLNTFNFMQQSSPNSQASSLIFADYEARQITPAAERRCETVKWRSRGVNYDGPPY